MDATSLNFIANVLILVAWPATVLFIIVYGLKSPWRVSMAGRTLMYKTFSMFLLLTLGILTNWIGDYSWEPAVRVFVYGTVAFMQWRLFMTLRAVQTKKVTLKNPIYTPVRNWIRCIKHRLKKRGK